jgi:hypothetical protein
MLSARLPLANRQVADAVEACGQHVHEEAADELVGGEGYHLVTLTAFAAKREAAHFWLMSASTSYEH